MGAHDAMRLAYLGHLSADCGISKGTGLETFTERLASLGIMGDQLRAPLSSSIRYICLMVRGVSGGPQLDAHDAERLTCLGQLSV